MIWLEIVIILIVIVKTVNAVMIVNAVKMAKSVAVVKNARAKLSMKKIAVHQKNPNINVVVIKSNLLKG